MQIEPVSTITSPFAWQDMFRNHQKQYANLFPGTGLTFGSQTYTNAQVKTALSAGIVFLPLINPDGVAYDQSSNS